MEKTNSMPVDEEDISESKTASKEKSRFKPHTHTNETLGEIERKETKFATSKGIPKPSF
jgi:hypothetical protein